ncbi:MAG: RdgB/HAM1 family non-canonical purine NTP pyrophosphatase [Eubacteriales bacterium]|nr:RdgB/HAM1 family non-canonical purine NTP pyrophosphatase [Eubacteriales bacterium]
MKRLILASHNKDKIREFEALLAPLNYAVFGMRSVGFEDEIVEDGSSFIENSVIKARALKKAFPHDAVLADDSGLSIEALGGEPGIYSARFGGEEMPYASKFDLIWQRLKATGLAEEEWRAYFTACLCLIEEDGALRIFEDQVHGLILPEPRGAAGFGYDPIFFCQEVGKSFAELSSEEKNCCSHRAKASRALLRYLDARDRH